MTIFLKIIRGYLISELTEYMGNSAAADKSIFNLLTQSLNAGRETALSTTKRGIATRLIHILNNLDPSTPTLTKLSSPELNEKSKKLNKPSKKANNSTTAVALDEAISQEQDIPVQDNVAADTIVKLLQDAKEEAKEKSDALNYDEGTFGPLMLDKIKVIDKFLEKLTDAQLQDITDNSDPYNQFCFHMASYLFKNTLAELQPSALEKITNNPKITNSRKLTREKEALVKEMISKCKEALDGLDKNNTKYVQYRKDCVLDNIDKLKRRNICKVSEYGINVTVPVTFAFFSTLNINGPKLGPEAGTLNDCLIQAETQIKMENIENVIGHISTNAM